jgi:hypothetical protein
MDKKSDYALQSVVELYAILCNTIEDPGKGSKAKVPIKSALYDYINNYLIYAAPFVLLKDEIGDKEQLVHDCYVVTKSIIDNSEISPGIRAALLKPLKESGIYVFTSKVFKLNHLAGYSNFLKNILSIKDTDEETERALVIKDLLRPIVLFLVTGFPINKDINDGMKENINHLSKYIDFQIKILFDIFVNIKLHEEKASKEKPEQYATRIIKNMFTFMELNQYPETSFRYSSDLLTKIYSILFEENKKDSKTNTIFKAIRDYRTIKFKIDKTDSKQHKEFKSNTGVRKNVTGTKRKSKKASIAISRK